MVSPHPNDDVQMKKINTITLFHLKFPPCITNALCGDSISLSTMKQNFMGNLERFFGLEAPLNKKAIKYQRIQQILTYFYT